MELFSLNGKTAIVIGGSKGLGKGMATGLASAGANVVLVSRTQAELDAAAAEISAETKSNAWGYAANITSLEGIDGLIQAVDKKFGGIDILINAAGINIRKTALDFTEEDWDTVQNTQLKYVFFMCQQTAKYMISKDIKGRIINIASLTSSLGFPNMISYAAAKGGIAQITKSLSKEWAGYGINVNAIAPGYYETAMTKAIFENKEYAAKLLLRIPLNRFGFPEDLAGIAVFLASDASNYITGQIIYVDGGFTSN